MDTKQIDLLYDNGFISIDSVFPQTSLDQLEQALDKLFPNITNSNSATAKLIKGHNVFEVTRAVNRDKFFSRCSVFKICQKLASNYLKCSARYTFDHAIYKYPGTDSKIGWHQDQVYQRKDLCMRSLHFWIPLQDSTDNNGGLQFSPGSHKEKLLTHKKIVNAKTLEAMKIESLKVISCSIPRGGLSIHLPYTLHRSLENNSDLVRKAWILHFSQYGKWDILRPKNMLKHISKISN